MSDQLSSPLRHKHLLLAGMVPTFYLAEWLLVAATASIYSWLRHIDCPQLGIWLLFWVGNLLLSAIFIACNDLLRIDMTLMQGLRRLTDLTRRRSAWFGLLLELGILIRLLIWDGPCQLLIYCRARLPSPTLQLVTLILSSGIQMFVWTKLYALGYDGIGDLLATCSGGLS